MALILAPESPNSNFHHVSVGKTVGLSLPIPWGRSAASFWYLLSRSRVTSYSPWRKCNGRWVYMDLRVKIEWFLNPVPWVWFLHFLFGNFLNLSIIQYIYNYNIYIYNKICMVLLGAAYLYQDWVRSLFPLFPKIPASGPSGMCFFCSTGGDRTCGRLLCLGHSGCVGSATSTFEELVWWEVHDPRWQVHRHLGIFKPGEVPKRCVFWILGHL